MAGLDRIGSREWTDTLRSAYTGPMPSGSGISLGGEIHDSLIDPRIKPGTRAYLGRMRELANPVDPGEDTVDFHSDDFDAVDFN